MPDDKIIIQPRRMREKWEVTIHFPAGAGITAWVMGLDSKQGARRVANQLQALLVNPPEIEIVE